MNDSGPRPIVLGAFEPFGGRRVNRSLAAVERVRPPPGVRLEKVTLPVDFERLPERIAEPVAARPAALVLVGEASGRRTVAVECVALNVLHARVPDNAGRRPRRERVLPDQALALPATWDADALLRAVHASGVPARLSHHAGTHACNASLYLALAAGPDCPVGFLHVPTWPWRLGPSTAALARALERVILTIAARRDT